MLDKRREERIPVEALPECLRTVIFTTGFFQENTAITVDATKSGMGFYAEGVTEKDLYVGQDITIKVLPYNYKLKSRVVYVKEVGENKIRFGVEFVKEQTLDKFHELLELDIYK
ncbi:MAG TPA: hypothetical protein PLE45_01390 [Spirochaetota bacterium]|nr:hypothetical protein [Spirochaetota bacterium]HOL56309.1 hypothetical protein [Spirochaetota bacterium]HPP03346.1 hypothetical protein [Spirochaetota bacterium]